MEKYNESTEWNMVSEVELIYKSKVKPSQRPKVTNSASSFRILIQYYDENKLELQEHFCVLFLNRAGRVLGISNISSGGITATFADVRLILALALKLAASSMILSHSHPSGNLQPSTADRLLTEKIKIAAAYHDIKIIDHIIVTSEGYLSMLDEGVL